MAGQFGAGGGAAGVGPEVVGLDGGEADGLAADGADGLEDVHGGDEFLGHALEQAGQFTEAFGEVAVGAAAEVHVVADPHAAALGALGEQARVEQALVAHVAQRFAAAAGLLMEGFEKVQRQNAAGHVGPAQIAHQGEDQVALQLLVQPYAGMFLCIVDQRVPLGHVAGRFQDLAHDAPAWVTAC